MGGATAPAPTPRAKTEAIPHHVGTTAMGFARCSTVATHYFLSVGRPISFAAGILIKYGLSRLVA
jgi:hypothetical protein